jgi:hypothetical protein
MQSIVIPLALLGALAAFALWLSVMLRHERTQHSALVAAAHERAQAHRQFTLTARQESAHAEPVASVVHPSTVLAVRAGSFCRVPGNVGRTKKGVVLVCEPSATGRPRWRRPTPLRAAS